MMEKEKRSGSLSALTMGALLAIGISVLSSVEASEADVAALEQRVADLKRELAEAQNELDATKKQGAVAITGPETAAKVATEQPAPEETTAVAAEPSNKIQLGPLTIGGAMRINYVIGSYEGGGGGPSRGGNGGNFELDTFRINMDLKHNQWLGKLEYRWYDGYNFMHTGWLGYQFDAAS